MVNEKNPGRLTSALRSLITLGPRTYAAERRFALWAIALGLCMFTSKYLERNELVSGLAAWLFPIITLSVALAVFYNYYQILMKSDELARKIQIDGISCGFGLGVLAMIVQEAFASLGAAQLDSNDLLMVMVIGWMAGQFWGHWKHQ